MSEYSTGPAAVRKEQELAVKVLCFQTHPGFLFLPGSCEIGKRTSAFSFFLSPFLGALMPFTEGILQGQLLEK